MKTKNAPLEPHLHAPATTAPTPAPPAPGPLQLGQTRPAPSPRAVDALEGQPRRSPPTGGPSLPKDGPRQSYADASSFGNKTANLALLSRLVAKAGLGDKIAIPEFIGVGHREVYQHLVQHGGVHFKQAEQELARSLAACGQRLTPEARTALVQVQKIVRSTLTKTPLVLDPSWLQARHSQRLMVRSTGREDSETLANAGGNLSVANVPAADASTLNQAVADVVASYWGERSIAQRLDAGDDVTAPAFVPVLLQQMAAEGKGTAIFSSGVLFTHEPEGPTPGLSQVQSTFGHNEAVVASLLPCDTFYIDDSVVRHSIKYKPERMVPQEASGELAMVANAPHLRLQAAVPDEVLLQLHGLGKSISAHYRQPMDIEWTYDHGAKKIFLLQARPLQVELRADPVSHLVLDRIRTLPQLSGNVVGAAGGQVRLLQSAQEVILAPDLAQALQLYLARPDKKQVQLVMVAHGAEPTSHEATTLRGARVAVLQVPRLAAAEALLQDGLPLLLDPGQGVLVALANLAEPAAAGGLAGLHAQGYLAPGWAKHPLPAELSMAQRQRDLSDTALMEILSGLAAAVGAPVAVPGAEPGRRPIPFTRTQLLYSLSQAAPRAARGISLAEVLVDAVAEDPSLRTRALVQLLRIGQVQLGTLKATPELAARGQRVYDTLVREVALAASHADAADGRMNFLAHLNWAVASLQQQGEVVHGDSFASLHAEAREHLQSHKTRAPLSPEKRDYMFAYARLSQLAMRAEVREGWSQFTQAIVQAPDLKVNDWLARLVLKVQALDIGSSWLNIVFADTWAKHPEPLACLAALGRDLLGPSNAEALAWVQTAQTELTAWRGHMGAWANPDQAATLIDTFSRGPLGESIGPAIEHFEAAGLSGKIAVLTWLGGFVDMLDSSIKSLKGSTQYEDLHAQVRDFSGLNECYMELLQHWVPVSKSFAGQKSGYDTVADSAREADNLFGTLLSEVETQLQTGLVHDLAEPLPPFLAKQLLNSPYFDVRAAKLGSSADFFQHQPQTLEDFFTFSHQSLLGVLSAINIDLGLTPERLPKQVAQVCSALTQAKVSLDPFTEAQLGQAPGITITGISMQGSRLSVDMQFSLREHGMRIELNADARQLDDAQLSVQMVGFAEHERQERVLLMADLFAAATGLSFPEGAKPTLEVFEQRSSSTNRALPDASTHQDEPPMCKVSWAWNLPLGERASPQIAAALPKLFSQMGRTTFDDSEERRSVPEIFATMQAYTPNLAGTVVELSEAFFARNAAYAPGFLTLAYLPPRMGDAEQAALGPFAPHALAAVLNEGHRVGAVAKNYLEYSDRIQNPHGTRAHEPFATYPGPYASQWLAAALRHEDMKGTLDRTYTPQQRRQLIQQALRQEPRPADWKVLAAWE